MAGRRGRGEGAIYKRSDGRWTAQVDVGYQGAKRLRKYIYGATRREVQEKLASVQGTVQKGLPLPPERLTVGRYLEQWLEGSARQRLRPNTFASYADTVRRHLVPEMGRLPLAKLSPVDVQGLMATKAAAGLSPRTVQYVRAVLRVALNQALKWGLVARNVASLVDGPRVRHQEVKPLTPEEAGLLLEAAKGDPFEALYVLALAAGLRRGELLGLPWSAVDLDRGTLRVSQTLQRIEGRLQIVEPKTDKSRRSIHLPQIAMAALRTHRTRQLEARLLAGSQWEESGLVFTSTVGTALDGANISHRFHAMLRRAGLEQDLKTKRARVQAGEEVRRIRFHDLRHAAASFLLSQGIDPRVLMDILGHSQISTTMDIYAHVMPAMHREAAAQMDAVLGGTSS